MEAFTGLRGFVKLYAVHAPRVRHAEFENDELGLAAYALLADSFPMEYAIQVPNSVQPAADMIIAWVGGAIAPVVDVVPPGDESSDDAYVTSMTKWPTKTFLRGRRKHDWR